MGRERYVRDPVARQVGEARAWQRGRRERPAPRAPRRVVGGRADRLPGLNYFKTDEGAGSSTGRTQILL